MYGHQDGNNSSLVGAIRRRSAPSLGSPPTPAPTTAHSPRSAPPGRSSRRKRKRAYVALWETKKLEEEEAKEKAAAVAVLAVQQPAVLCIQSCFRRWQQRGAILALLPLAHQKAKARALFLARWLARLTCPGSSESVAAARIQEALQRRCALVQLRRSEAAAVRIQMAFRRQNSRRACARLRQAAAARAWAREESKEARKGLGNGIWNEGQLAETIEAASRGCRGCGSAPGLDFVLDHKRGVGDGCLRFRGRASPRASAVLSSARSLLRSTKAGSRALQQKRRRKPLRPGCKRTSWQCPTTFTTKTITKNAATNAPQNLPTKKFMTRPMCRMQRGNTSTQDKATAITITWFLYLKPTAPPISRES